MFDHFGFLAPFYDKLIRPKDPQEIREFGDLPSCELLLDVGGGTGRIAKSLRSHFLSPRQMIALFPHCQAKVSIETRGYNAWVIVERNE